jgi:hypothetical protein
MIESLLIKEGNVMSLWNKKIRQSGRASFTLCRNPETDNKRRTPLVCVKHSHIGVWLVGEIEPYSSTCPVLKWHMNGKFASSGERQKGDGGIGRGHSQRNRGSAAQPYS